MKHSLHFRDRLFFGLANVAAAVMMFEPTAIAQAQAPFVLDVPAKSVPVPKPPAAPPGVDQLPVGK